MSSLRSGGTPFGDDNLTALAPGAPRAFDADPAGYFVPLDGTHHVIYDSSDGHLHELSWTTGAVTHRDLTSLARAPLIQDGLSQGFTKRISAYFVAADGTQHVIYRSDIDNHLHELRWGS
jgi:hypothetical protein